MFDIAWSELLLIAVVALVAIGPKDLPKALFLLGRGLRTVRGMARQLQQQFEQLTYEAEVAARADAAEPTPPPEAAAVPAASTTSPAPNAAPHAP
jgi:Tat protein translocase TatB subunit